MITHSRVSLKHTYSSKYVHRIYRSGRNSVWCALNVAHPHIYTFGAPSASCANAATRTRRLTTTSTSSTIQQHQPKRAAAAARAALPKASAAVRHGRHKKKSKRAANQAKRHGRDVSTRRSSRKPFIHALKQPTLINIRDTCDSPSCSEADGVWGLSLLFVVYV